MTNPAMTALRIHLYVHCWNEETILPHLFRHYPFVERFVVYDNHSTDGTSAIVAAEPRAELRSFDTGEQADMEAYLRVKNGAWKESRGTADFVIVCDADEFLFHPALETLIGRMKAEGATVLKPTGYDMIGERPPRPDEDLVRLVPNGARRREFDKCLLFDPGAIDEIKYGIGAHTCGPTGRVKLFGRQGLALLHYKYLGLDYVRRRFEAIAPRITRRSRDRGLSRGYSETIDQTRARLQRLSDRAVRVVPPDGAAPPSLDPPADLDAVRATALAALAARDWPAAEAGLAAVLAWRPDDVDCLGNLASVLRRLGDEVDAGWCFRQALSLAPDRHEIWFNYGNQLLAQRNHVLAEECFRAALRLRPDFPLAWVQLGNARLAADDPAAAEAAWRSALDRSPTLVPALRRLGMHLAAAGRFREAEPVLRALVAAAPADAAAQAAHRGALDRLAAT